MNNSDARLILEDRLEQAHSLATAWIMATQPDNPDLTGETLSGVFWVVQELIGQAKDTLPHLFPPVVLPEDPEPIEDLQHETLEVLRDTVAEIENVLVTGKTLLAAVDSARKPT